MVGLYAVAESSRLFHRYDECQAGQHQTLLFFFNDTATTEIYTLSLHDALPICLHRQRILADGNRDTELRAQLLAHRARSEEHTSELQSPCNLVCRLLLEKKNFYTRQAIIFTIALICHEGKRVIRLHHQISAVGL